MDPCRFLRIVVGNLSLKFPSSSSSSSSCFCKIKLKGFASQTAPLPINDQIPSPAAAACFTLSKSEMDKLLVSKSCYLKVEVYASRGGFCTKKFLGSISLPLDFKGIESMSRPVVFHNGSTLIKTGSQTMLNLRVQAEPDPRFVFQFDGQPECSPQVFLQTNDKVLQPVFTCRFNSRLVSEETPSKSWLRLDSLRNGESKNRRKERKGWAITIHDLSGSPVAAASMVTPFVPSPGSDRVNKSNPGAWLILLPGDSTWKPWGRLEAWREGNDDRIGYRFELLPDPTTTAVAEPVILYQSTLNTKSGGKFAMDINSGSSPISTPGSSCDMGSGSGSGYGSGSDSGSWVQFMYSGFVMSSMVKGERRKLPAPEVVVGVRHVSCTEDAAGFVALAAALNLSVDACRPFSKKLRKELTRQDSHNDVVLSGSRGYA
ncbi:uncharacterized protein LOC124938111 [Impatiens glandulifera]|uniref:uncharacterized protein LOC124938111 n=1 Tax=Impatiens glandulifera TaxID=253017 RepID=UPI001FB0FFAF|nr:uncharacterized protein LOC124938111 [Impatiens glandulifera]